MQPLLRASQALAPAADQRGILFYGLPTTTPSGDAAITAIWQRVQQTQTNQHG